MKNHTLGYLLPTNYKTVQGDDEKASAIKINNISTELGMEMVPATPQKSRLIFLEAIHLVTKLFYKMLKSQKSQKIDLIM